MKKYIFSVLMAAMAAFTFSSCEDVPEPYTQPTKPDAPSAGEPKGTGTAADPFNVAGIVKYIEDGGSADQEVYTKGKVVSVKAGSFDATYGSLKYYISDDGTTNNQFYVYNGYAGPNRTKFSGEDALKPGDEVVICGKAKNYSGTNEYDTGNYLVSLNGKPTSGSTTPDTPTDGYINELSTLTATQRLQVTIIPLRQQLHLKATLFLRLSTSLHLKARHWSSLTFSAMLQKMVQPLRE
jgi:DNA/RNA endonuclease YhcR with UshA esterase domain